MSATLLCVGSGSREPQKPAPQHLPGSRLPSSHSISSLLAWLCHPVLPALAWAGTGVAAWGLVPRDDHPAPGMLPSSCPQQSVLEHGSQTRLQGPGHQLDGTAEGFVARHWTSTCVRVLAAQYRDRSLPPRPLRGPNKLNAWGGVCPHGQLSNVGCQGCRYHCGPGSTVLLLFVPGIKCTVIIFLFLSASGAMTLTAPRLSQPAPLR